MPRPPRNSARLERNDVLQLHRGSNFTSVLRECFVDVLMLDLLLKQVLLVQEQNDVGVVEPARIAD